MKLLANCRPSGQRILALHPPEAVLFTHSAPVCGSPRKKLLLVFVCSERCLQRFFFKKQKQKQKMTGLPDYIDSSTVKSPGIAGHPDYVFLLSR